MEPAAISQRSAARSSVRGRIVPCLRALTRGVSNGSQANDR